MTPQARTQSSPLKNARLVHKVGKQLGMPGASVERLVAKVLELQTAQAERAHPAFQRHQVQFDRVDATTPAARLQVIAGEMASAHGHHQVLVLSAAMEALRHR